MTVVRSPALNVVWASFGPEAQRVGATVLEQQVDADNPAFRGSEVSAWANRFPCNDAHPPLIIMIQ